MAPEVSLPSTAIALAAGLAAIGHAALWLGLAGLLRPYVVVPLIGAAQAVGWRAWRELASRVRESLPSVSWWKAAVAGGLLFPQVVLACYPSLDFDATMYHLPYARAFAAAGRLPFLTDLRFPIFPQLMEVLFAILFPAGADLPAQFLSAGVTLLCALLIAVWGRLESEPAVGWLAAAAFLGNPIVGYFGATAYIEPGLTLFVTAALFSYRRFRATRSPEWIALAGLFAGTAASVKYLGLFFVVALGIVFAAAALRARSPRPALLYGAACAAAFGPWYVRIFLETGNPVFPYFARLFGPNAWDLSGYQPRWTGAGDLLVRLATAPFDLLFPARHFDWHPPFSPVCLVVAPALLLALVSVRTRGWRTVIGIVGVYVFFVLTLPRDPRYLMPVLPTACLAAGVAIAAPLRARLRSRSPAVVRASVGLVAVAAVLLLPTAAYSARLVRRRGPPPVSSEGRHRYRFGLPLYPAIDFLNRTRSDRYSLYAFDAENMVFFARGRFRGDWFGPASYGPMRAAAAAPETLWSALRAMGADTLLFASWRPPDLDSPGFLRFFRPLYADHFARVYEIRPKPE